MQTAREGRGSFPCHLEPVGDLGRLVVSAAVGVAGEAQVRLTTSVEPGLSVYADPARVTQIVGNLVSNALKFTDAAVDIEAHRVGERVVIRVADHGEGIPENFSERIFERWSQVRGAAEHGAGSGLGLYITRELVLAHKGTIRCRPTDGGGATFEVRLPFFHRPESSE